MFLLAYDPMLILVWTLLSMLIGMMGSRRKFRFYGHFLVSMMLSPFVGVIVLCATSPRPRVPKNPPPTGESKK
jgi:hypothetical protein